jgi:hypothetical protein
MAMNKKRAERLQKQRRPVFGWVKEGKGWYYAPNDFAQQTAFISEDFEKFAKRSRARWDLIEYLRAIFIER